MTAPEEGAGAEYAPDETVAVEEVVDAEVVDADGVDPDTSDAGVAGDDGDADAVGESSSEAIDPAVAQSEKEAELLADLQRLQAEYANYRRRAERERLSAVESGKASLINALLPTLDDLERARAHGDLADGPLKGVADKIAETLKSQGLTAFGEQGEAFDPSLHEAVQHDGDGAEPVIDAVYRQGYRLGERLLRTAMVTVTDGE